MFSIFADADVTTAVTRASFFPPEFWPSIVMALIYVVFAAALFYPLWKLIDWITPGDLNTELLGTPDERHAITGAVVKHGKQPNFALAIVVAAMVLGFCHIIVAAVK